MKDDGTHDVSYCLPYQSPKPDIWQLINVYDQYLIQEGENLPYADFEQGAKNFRQACGIFPFLVCICMDIYCNEFDLCSSH